MILKTYRAKRNFERTSEPKLTQTRVKKSKGLIFVIQKHDARRLHYDFRLELKGVLKSWAVPKGPSANPQQKRLAVEVEDHPLEYAKFEGTIPQGQYGAGTVMIWDTGTWQPIGDPVQAYKKGHLEFTLHGKKLRGRWNLVRMKAEENGKTPWLLIKSDDESGRSSKRYDILKEQPGSVVFTKRKHAVKKLPRLKPQLASLADQPPLGKGWVHEVKYDGYRLLAYFENDEIKLVTRNGVDWTKKFPTIATELKKLKLDNTILDGELVAFDDVKHMSFQALQRFPTNPSGTHLVYYVFDLPFHSGGDLRQMPLLERKRKLRQILKGGPKTVRYCEHLTGNGQKVLEACCSLNLEGIVSKRSDSIYESKRTKTWQKIKCVQREEFLIIGFTTKNGQRGIRSLLLGYYDADGDLRYGGRVGTGFTRDSLQRLEKRLVEKKTAPFKKIPAGINQKTTTWVEPELVAEVQFSERTDDNVLRHPVFLGLRSDKVPEDTNTAISNRDKILFRKKKISKGDLADFYMKIAPWMLPYIVNRPLMILRCPNGVSKECFFQKHYGEKELPPGLLLKKVQEGRAKKPYLYIQDESGLSALAQLAAVEIHPWGSSNESLEQPDRMIFDLDPGPKVAWKEVITAARRLRDCLLQYGLKSFVKTSGKKGLHVVVPLKPHSDWKVIKEFSRQIAVEMVEDYPDDYVATMTKSKRIGKIFVDYFRNGRGSSAVAPYSCRAHSEASVSLPLTWTELARTKSADAYDIFKTLKRLKSRGDPWSGFFKLKQKI